MDKLTEARRVFDLEINALMKTRDALDDTFVGILDLIISCTGKVVVIGMGKPGHIAGKIAATFASLGTPAFHLHPAEAMHGDLGMISSNDIVIAISYSGESEEIVKILPNIKVIGAKLVAITANVDSTLSTEADIVQVLPRFDEACYLGLAPTSSTTVELCYGDALAVVASIVYGFRDVDFGKFHPAGSLGKKLILRVEDLMVTDSDNAVIQNDSMLVEAIVELSKKGLGIVSVIDASGNLQGVITDGDLRRQLEKGVDIYSLHTQNVMSRGPVTIERGKMAVEALRLMKEKNVSAVPVVVGNKVVGTIMLRFIVDAGIIL